MSEEQARYSLDPEVLDGIKPFSGAPEAGGAMSLIAGGAAMQQVKTGYTTAVAVQRPRSIARVVANVLEEARLAGASFYYGWTAKGASGKQSKIEGGSIDLAMCIARNYGNDAIDVEVAETPSHYLFKGTFIDLETGFTCPRLFRQRKQQNIGMRDEDRAEDIVFQIGQSKAIRNAVLRAMPEWLEKRAIETAKEAELASLKPENIALARAKIFSFFSPYGVTQERMESRIGRTLEEWTPNDVVELRGMATALKEGRVTAQELFPSEETGKKAEALKERIREAWTAPVETTPELEKPKASPDRAIVEGFWNLKSKGWPAYHKAMTPEMFNSWSPYVRDYFLKKCESMKTPWPPQAEATRPATEGSAPPPTSTPPPEELPTRELREGSPEWIRREAEGMRAIDPTVYGEAVNGEASLHLWSMETFDRVKARFNQLLDARLAVE